MERLGRVGSEVAADILRRSLAVDELLKDGLLVRGELLGQLGEGVILVFQGKDRKGRAAKLLLINPKAEGDTKAGRNITLSYHLALSLF